MTKNNDTYIRTFQWGPDSKKIVYTDRKNRTNLLDVSNKQLTTISQSLLGEARNVSFSPDNNWLTYSRVSDNNFSIVYVYDIAGKKEYPVTDKWYESYSPVFSTDGKYLVFTSARDFNPTYSQTEWNHVYNNMGGVYLALLSKDTASPFMETDAEVAIESTPAKADASKKDETKNEASTPVVKIDIEGITDRIVKLPLPGSNYYDLYSDGTNVYYFTKGGMKMFDLKKQKEETVSDAAMMVDPAGKKAVFFKDDQLFVTDIPKGKADLSKPVNLANMKITVDYTKEWAQIFDEAWRAFRDGFYLENMHGKDWKAIKEKYAALLPYVKTRLDLNYIIGEMIGELGVGHAYVNPGEVESPKRVSMGLLLRHKRRTGLCLGKNSDGASPGKNGVRGRMRIRLWSGGECPQYPEGMRNRYGSRAVVHEGGHGCGGPELHGLQPGAGGVVPHWKSGYGNPGQGGAAHPGGQIPHGPL